MNTTPIYERNLLALSACNASLAARLKDVEPAPITWTQTPGGEEVPSVSQQERWFPLHSLRNPVKEAERFAGSFTKSGCLIILGLGGAYHIAPFLKSTAVSNIVIIDKDLPLIAGLLMRKNFRHLFLDSRVRFLIDPDPETLKETLFSTYYPAVSGNLQILPLRARTALDKEGFESVVSEIKSVIQLISDDYTVQSRFGKRWFSNTLANLSRAEPPSPALEHYDTALVTAAGPSLEEQIPAIKARNNNRTLLIATDTSLPSLLEADLLPDLILSIDCQHITYNHFINDFPAEIPLVLDLASPPFLARLSRRPVFITSGHPFSQYINRFWKPFPAVDTSGGNVSHAALSLAVKLGVRRIFLYGADFSYPEGKSYARGTYIYPYFFSRAGRTCDIESHFFRFLMRNKDITLEERKGYNLYRTRPMANYKIRLEETAGEWPVELYPVPGRGELIQIPPSPPVSRTDILPLFASGPARCGYRNFLNEYRQKIEALPDPQQAEGPSYYLNALSQDQALIWKTLMPAAAYFREFQMSGAPGTEVLAAVHRWSLKTLEHFAGR